MKSRKGFAYFSIVALLSFFLRANATSQVQKAEEPASSGLPSTKTPEHPITEEQLRTFFKVTHLLSVNRQLIHEKLEVQRRQMPEWYPQSVWDEIADAVENVDLAAVALPAYQKCISEDDAKFVISFAATPQGQKLAQTFLAKQAEAQQAGMAPVKAYDQARAELARDEDAEVERILSGISPTELRDIESHSARWQQMQPALRQMRDEMSQAIKAKQVELTRAIAAKHRSELVEAKHRYEASQPSAPSSQTPQ
jgi:hypothetical protein